MAVSIVSAAEEIILNQFQWQTDQTYLSDDTSKLPMVIMSDMTRSPVAKSINLLVRSLLHEDQFSEDEYYNTFVKIFLHLQEGVFFC